MENFIPETETLPKQEHKKKVWSYFLKRHLMIIALSLATVATPESVNAQSEIEKPAASSLKQGALENERKKDFHLFEELVKQEKIKEKLAFLNNSFGEFLGNFFIASRISADVGVLEQLEKRQKDNDAFVNKDALYAMTLGSIVSQRFNERWKQPKISLQPVSLKNTESFSGLFPKEIEFFLNTNYPKGYISSSVASIEFIDIEIIKGNLQILGKNEGLDIYSPIPADSRSNIRIYNTREKLTKEDFIDILKHEVHHANDWQNSKLLSSAERVSMLYDVALRSIASDRFMSPYVEGIKIEELETHFKGKIDNETAKDQLLKFVHATEYWAEIAKAYFNNKQQFKKDHLKDYDVVKKWIDKMTKN